MNRIDIIKRNISEEYKLLAFYEEDLVTADDPKRIMRNEKAIADSKRKIDDWHKELEYLSTKPAEELTLYNNQNVDLQFEYDFFLSFSSRNIDTVYQIYEVFQRYQLRVFISEITLKSLGGTSFFDKINHALNSSKHFVLLCTPEAMQSQWVKTEYQAFYHNFTMHNPDSRKFFVMRGPGFHHSLVPLLLSVIQLVDNPEQIIRSLNIKPIQEIKKAVEPIAPKQNTDEQEAERKRQEELKRQAEQEAERKRQAEKLRQAEQEAERQKQEELKRQKEQEAELKRQEELKRRKEQEDKQQRQEELKRRKEQEDKQQRQEELKRRKEQEAEQQRQEELKNEKDSLNGWQNEKSVDAAKTCTKKKTYKIILITPLIIALSIFSYYKIKNIREEYFYKEQLNLAEKAKKEFNSIEEQHYLQIVYSLKPTQDIKERITFLESRVLYDSCLLYIQKYDYIKAEKILTKYLSYNKNDSIISKLAEIKNIKDLKDKAIGHWAYKFKDNIEGTFSLTHININDTALIGGLFFFPNQAKHILIGAIKENRMFEGKLINTINCKEYDFSFKIKDNSIEGFFYLLEQKQNMIATRFVSEYTHEMIKKTAFYNKPIDAKIGNFDDVIARFDIGYKISIVGTSDRKHIALAIVKPNFDIEKSCLPKNSTYQKALINSDLKKILRKGYTTKYYKDGEHISKLN